MMNDSPPVTQKISFRISMVYIVFTAVILFSLIVFTRVMVTNSFYAIIKKSFHAAELHTTNNLLKPATQQNVDIISGLTGFAVLFTDTEKKISINSSNLSAEIKTGNFTKLLRDESNNRTFYTLNNRMTGATVFFAYEITSATNKIIFFRQASDITETIASIDRYLLMSGILALAVSSIIIILLASRIAAPIRGIIDFSRKLADGHLDERIPVDYPNELGIIQRSLNTLAEKIGYQIYFGEIEKKRLINAFENIADSACYIDTDGTIIIANASFIQLFSNSGSSSRLYFEIIRNGELNSRIKKSLVTKNGSSFTIQIGKNFYDTIISTVITEEKFNGLILTLRDITEKKIIETMKTELVGNLSHELKTPITIIKGFLETIQNMPDENQTRKKYLQKALTNIERQNAIISDMLKLNRIETSSDFIVESFSLSSVLSPIIEILTPKLLASQIQLSFDAEEFSTIKTKGNRFLSEQIFFNLIDNAINYNEKNGFIRIELRRETTSVTISIADSGIGIPEDSVKRIFERFYRVDKARSRASGGTGLGLSIAKHAAEIQHWKLSVTSQENKGTVFYVHIPLTDQ